MSPDDPAAPLLEGERETWLLMPRHLTEDQAMYAQGALMDMNWDAVSCFAARYEALVRCTEAARAKLAAGAPTSEPVLWRRNVNAGLSGHVFWQYIEQTPTPAPFQFGSPAWQPLYASPVEAAQPAQPVGHGCFYPDGRLEYNLVGCKADCDYWAAADDRTEPWVVGALYAAPPEPLVQAEPKTAPVGERETMCPSCKGSGTQLFNSNDPDLPTNEGPCGRCGGTGMLASPQDPAPYRGGDSYEASMLRNLIARIHGDGGHYVEQHGLDKALEDADTLVAGWRAAPAATPIGPTAS